MAKQAITFVVDSIRDRDILHWLDGQANKSAAIRAAIRAHLERAPVSIVDVYEAIQDLRRAGFVSPPASGPSGQPGGEEPDDVAAALDGLGL